MRAVNNTLREIILRERPLTVTNNDSLVLSPLPVLALRSRSLSLSLSLPPSRPLSRFSAVGLGRSVYNVPCTCSSARAVFDDCLERVVVPVPDVSAFRGVVASLTRTLHLCALHRPRAVSRGISIDVRTLGTFLPDVLPPPSLAYPYASELIRSTGSVDAITASACIQRTTDVTVVA